MMWKVIYFLFCVVVFKFVYDYVVASNLFWGWGELICFVVMLPVMAYGWFLIKKK